MANTLKVMCWEGYELPSITGPFELRSKIKIDTTTLLSDTQTASELVNAKNLDIDVLNINNAYVRDCLNLHGLIKKLDKGRFEHYLQNIHPSYSPLLPWSYSPDGELIGIGQRFGHFNLVVNTSAISRLTAQDQGFDLANDPGNTNRFGILDYPDFNVFHICIGAGLNPFAELDKVQLCFVEQVTNDWFARARMITDDHQVLNTALINGDIDFYISGGVYTTSPARLAGHSEIVAIVPERGPIEGNGGIVFSEITSVLNRKNGSPHSEAFLEYLLEPETATKIAFTERTSNPVAQMGDPKVFNAFSKSQLNAIQWNDLEEDLARCSHYRIPPNNTQLLSFLAVAKQRRVSRGKASI